jgi:hypothetical protein
MLAGRLSTRNTFQGVAGFDGEVHTRLSCEKEIEFDLSCQGDFLSQVSPQSRQGSHSRTKTSFSSSTETIYMWYLAA